MAKVSLRAYNREIETMIDRGQFDEAIAHCRHILKTYPKHLETYRLLGKAYLESRKYADAVDIFSRILATVPNDFVAQVGMSIIRDEENKLDDAIWHMERAFETQPSNPAIQAELQRLYARRDGVRPPRIRMTRGALANMYVQGELYPQAISEIKSVLKDDPERADMQALLARALYKSNSKNDAADVATSLLRRYPYSLDANRVLAEILGSEHPETAQMYRQRVFELDPYAAQVTGTIFLASAVSDAAVNIERLEWDGRPVALEPDWTERAISPETGEQPDWSEPSSFGGIQSGNEAIFGAPPAEPASTFGSIESAPTSVFGAAPLADEALTSPEEEIPDFLRAAGWGAATGAFDESKSAFADEEAKPSESLEQGDLPDWVKAMKPAESRTPEPEQDEEIPDWIKAIGAGAIASQAFDRSEKKEEPEPAQTTGMEETTQWLGAESAPGATTEDNLSSEFAWLGTLDETAGTPAEAGNEDLSFLGNLDAGETTQVSGAKDDELDWLKALDGGNELKPATPQTGEPDWLRDLGGTDSVADEPDWLKNLDSREAEPTTPQGAEPDWLKGAGEPPTMPSSEEDTDWLKGIALAGGVGAISHLAQDEDTDQKMEEPIVPASAASQTDESDWLKSLGDTEAAPASGQTDEPDWLKGLGSTEAEPATSQAEELDWLKNLGDTETTPAPAQTDEPDWLKGLGSTEAESATSQAEELDWLKNLGDTEAPPASGQTEEPDWLKGLAEPETPPAAAHAEEPDWLKGLGEPQSQPSSASEDDMDWLKGLAIAGGAAAISNLAQDEPSDEKEEKSAAPTPVESDADFLNQLTKEPILPAGPESTPSSLDLDHLGTSDQERDDSFAWLEGLAAKQGATEGLLTNPEERLEDEPEWVKQAKGLKSEPPVSQAPVEQSLANAEELGKSEQDQDDAFAWLESLAAKQGATEGLLTKPEDRLEEEPEWVKQAKDLNVPQEPVSTPLTSEPEAVFDLQQEQQPSEVDEVEAWLKNLEGEQAPGPTATADETAVWLKRLEEGEAPQAEEPVATPATDLPEWLQNVQVASEEEKSATVFAEEADLTTTWLPPVEDVPAQTIESKAEEDVLPSWLGELEKEEEQIPTPADADDLPAWLLAEETAPSVTERTTSSDWRHAEENLDVSALETQPAEEQAAPEPLPASPFEMAEAETVLEPEPAPVMEAPETSPAPQPEPVAQRETVGLNIPTVDPVLAMARDELARNNVDGALGSYGKLIKKARYLDEVIYDLREALYRYPVDVNLWQSLGDAYMRANRLQDALDAYTKAEELLR
jgi:tetratricopeptide (TPR) repeat protein